MKGYEAFIKILELGSFTKAAEALGFTQSAISQMIIQLEAELGTTLLVRSRKGVALTADGEELLPYIKNIYHAEMELAKKKAEMNGMYSGLIRIGTFSSVSSHFLPPLMKAFKARYLDVQFELHQSDYTTIHKWILDGTVDFGFTHGDASAHLITTPLFNDELRVVLPIAHPLASHTTISIKEVVDEPLILVHEGEINDALKLFALHDLQPTPEYTVHDDYTIMAMIEQGLGYAIMPELVLKGCYYDLAIKPLAPQHSRTIHLAYKNKDVLPRASRAFIEFILRKNDTVVPL
ncbi:MAG: LysR family transcriptional regulator [Solibacillus sp.]